MILLKNNAYLLIALLSASSFFISCKDKSSKDPQTITSGNISIVVDETLAPIIQDQLAIFESTYSDASIELIERPEKLAINHLLSDSSKVARSEEHTSELQSRPHLVCRLLLEKKKK